LHEWIVNRFFQTCGNILAEEMPEVRQPDQVNVGNWALICGPLMTSAQDHQQAKKKAVIDCDHGL